MSPFCPQCLAVADQSDSRCGLDQQFLQRRTCQECEAELFPRELYCAHCGVRATSPTETLIVPPAASGRRILGTVLLDYFSVSILIFIMGWDALGFLTVLIAPAASFLYRASARSGGRQSFGQSVFHSLTTCETAGPASFESALRRGVFELLYVPRLLLGGSTGPEHLEQKTSTLELHIA